VVPLPKFCSSWAHRHDRIQVGVGHGLAGSRYRADGQRLVDRLWRVDMTVSMYAVSGSGCAMAMVVWWEGRPPAAAQDTPSTHILLSGRDAVTQVHDAVVEPALVQESKVQADLVHQPRGTRPKKAWTWTPGTGPRSPASTRPPASGPRSRRWVRALASSLVRGTSQRSDCAHDR